MIISRLSIPVHLAVEVVRADGSQAGSPVTASLSVPGRYGSPGY